jgi:hypothetical protein
MFAVTGREPRRWEYTFADPNVMFTVVGRAMHDEASGRPGEVYDAALSGGGSIGEWVFQLRADVSVTTCS